MNLIALIIIAVIAAGEKYLDYQWQPTTATTYIEYKRTGDESLLKAQAENLEALKCLIAAEKEEQKGRFIMQIADLIWMESTSGFKSDEMKAAMKDACCSFKDQIDKLDPSICRTVLNSIK